MAKRSKSANPPTEAEMEAFVKEIKAKRAAAKEACDGAVQSLETQIDCHKQSYEEELDRITKSCFEKTGHRHIDGLIRGQCPYCGFNEW